MRCETCDGTGWKDKVHRVNKRLSPQFHWLEHQDFLECLDCGGTGVAHCCEGDREQPSDGEARCAS
jgi:hypothetical protein